MKVIRNIVPIQTIMEEVKQYQKPWWVWSPLHSENVETKAEMEGVSHYHSSILSL